MPYKHDVFISYPHLSNLDDDANHNGWVAKFHKRLKDRLTQHLGREALIWRDNKLGVGAKFGDEIRDRLRDSRMFLCILSPAYLKSEWCLKELSEFSRLAQQGDGLFIGNLSRIITVVNTFVPPAEHPPQLKEAIYCEFFKKSEDWGGMPLELSQEQGEYGYEEYKLNVDKIAWSIAQAVKASGDEEEQHQKELERTVYLAETTRDCAEYRNKVRDELVARELIVLEDKPQPDQLGDDFRECVQRNLRRAFMSVHLVGKSYGTVLEEADGKSVTHLQNELAAAHSRENEGFKRLVWIRPNLETPEPNQQQFLDHLRASEEAQAGAQLYDNRPFEDLKTRIVQLLTKTPPKPASDNLVRIYLMCDKPDTDYVGPVWRYLYDKGFEVIPPAEDNQDAQFIRYHKDNLMLCDATLILYGNTKWNWVQLCLNDVSKRVKGWGREDDIRCKAILMTDPQTEYKSVINTHVAKLLPPCYNGLSPQALEESLKEFISALES